jgi:hypothetical protein
VDNRKRIRELRDETIALADDKTLCQAERHCGSRPRERAIRALLQAEKQMHLAPKTLGELTDEFDAWARVGAADRRQFGQVEGHRRPCRKAGTQP